MQINNVLKPTYLGVQRNQATKSTFVAKLEHAPYMYFVPWGIYKELLYTSNRRKKSNKKILYTKNNIKKTLRLEFGLPISFYVHVNAHFNEVMET